MVWFLIVQLSPVSYSADLVCGIATGFPPYQFREQGKPAGLDVETVSLISKKMNCRILFYQDDWDHVFNRLRSGTIDFIAGMEINEIREKLFDFTRDYYHRYDVVFIRKDDPNINRVTDLYNEIITGDRHSFVELDWEKKGIKDRIRIMQTDTKQEAMKRLGAGMTRAAIMPKAVGIYLADQMDIKVKILVNPDPGSRVGLAVKKGNTRLLTTIDRALEALIDAGHIDALYTKWIGPAGP